ncbi:Oligopeptide transporter [Wickerhamomyces ciferrii]|uniref:Oligopeptide transporter n=1 Tax=Wickerhamomyces ciferrii (strain ATCC 14091 / BCRC 22168 / CBS 111 / JCM 3599 / NBRC 0793 / NRRL Y-1031 F-60-10) TaxID=1206466 RepID=K0KSV3_WICCF|nr:Oligopeptide transporter [Wickerhamomyces ciferrii]CCH44459.1 Oligopeptide transporter [Wickerhamomyces ciferrii]
MRYNFINKKKGYNLISSDVKPSTFSDHNTKKSIEMGLFKKNNQISENSITRSKDDDLEAASSSKSQIKAKSTEGSILDSHNEEAKLGKEIEENVIEIESDDYSFVEGDISLLNNSPYPEVREVVPNTDDPTININHWRTWVLTTIFVIVFSAVNQFFSLRYPSLTINYLVAQVIAYPVGKFLARVLPDIRFKYPWFNLNPGPYTIKEHGILTICVALTSSTPYAMNILISTTNFFKRDFGTGYEILLVWTTQCLGYGLAGLTKRFVVDPPSMIWPQTLISVSMFEALHSSKIDSQVVNGWKISRYSFFLVVLIINFVWYWFPGFIFKGLSYFNFVLWGSKTRNNFVANFIFGVSGGIGALPITFDYTQITQAMTGSPFATPFSVIANTYLSVFIFFILILPILYFTNTWYAKYLPVISAGTFDNKQKKYDVNKIMGDNFRIDKEKYKQYSPLFVPFSYLLSYALNFAAVTSLFVHVGLYHGKDIWRKFRDARAGGLDIHQRLYLKNYKQVPDWWYAVVFVVFLALSFVTVCHWDTGLPAWGLVVALLISIVTFLPQGILEATTNQEVGLNIITELIGGYIFPFRPMANLLIKIYGFIVMRQGLNLSRDLKLGLYLKIAPRILFFIQIYSTLLAGVTQVLVQQWMRSNIEGICEPSQKDGFICAGARTITNAAVIWSIPQYLFSAGQRYSPLLLFFIIGPVLSFCGWLLHRRWPDKIIGKFNAPIFFVGPGNIPPATPYNYGCYFVLSAFLNWLRNKWPRWDAKYKFIMGAGVETGVAISVVVIFLCAQYPGGKLSWWGNEVYKNTIDLKGSTYYKLPEGQTFGPDKWW